MKYLKSLLAVGVVAALAGCSPDDQDVVDSTQSAVVVNGAVIDPFIASAVVFADYNEDDVLDPFEPWAFTDKDGYYSVAKDGTDYCASTSRYCLKLPSNDPVKLVAVGGYDLTTLERINSRMSTMYTGTSGIQYITPLTSVGDLSLNEQQSIDANQNIMENAFISSDSAFGLAFNIHKVVELISGVIAEEYPAIGDDEDLPIDVSGYTYRAINKLGKEEKLSLASLLAQLTDDQVDKILNDVRAKLDAFIIKKNNGVTNKSIQRVASASNASNIGERVRELTKTLSRLHSLLSTQLSQDFTPSKARLMQILANNSIGATTEQLQDVTDLLEGYITNETFLNKLAEDSFDADYFENLAAQSNLDGSTLRMNNRSELPTDLTNMQLVLTDKNVKRDAVIGFFFDGDNSGNITACVKFQNLRKPNDSQNTNGTVLTGSWDKTDYIIDLTLTLASTEEALRIKTTDSSSFIFDYDKNEKNWSTSTAFSTTSITVPTTDQQCKDWIASL